MSARERAEALAGQCGCSIRERESGHLLECDRADRIEGIKKLQDEWKHESKDWERGVKEFGHPMDPDHNHHEVRDWLTDAFNAGTLAANGEAFDQGRLSVIEPARELLQLVKGRMMHNHGAGIECGSCLVTHRIDSFLELLKP